MRKLTYTNDMGYRKLLILEPSEDSKYKATLWCLDNGEFCGSGEVTQEWVDGLREHYSDIEEVSES